MSQLLLSQNFLSLFLLFMIAVIIGGVIVTIGVTWIINRTQRVTTTDAALNITWQPAPYTVTKQEIDDIATNVLDPKVIPWAYVVSRRNARAAKKRSLWQ